MARGELKTIKFQMMLSESEARTLDEWAQQHGFKSRAEVIRRLCQLALLVDERAVNVARNLRILDLLALRFMKQVRGAHENFRGRKSRLQDRLAELSEIYHEEIFDQVGDLAVDLHLLLETIQELRSDKNLSDVVELMRQNRQRTQETSEALAIARQNRREERKRLQGVDFNDLQKRMEIVIKSSADLELAQQAAHEEINRWLEGAKAKKEEIKKLEEEREAYLAERHKHKEDRPLGGPGSDEGQGQT
ncbi:metal-responsive CopG/Arc/MetJ family transcriptional regulator [Sinorhizobium meliloti]|uniref:hypothetical protein n=1 Tax=Rhizobium meliloti TaxID=382 RepID=UPI000FD7DC4D|nr:hypothetical protein [Sinorhizobium meliloti]RVH32357.1 hypothetical protein CN215_01780 [Sinorhizobium meliloti]